MGYSHMSTDEFMPHVLCICWIYRNYRFANSVHLQTFKDISKFCHSSAIGAIQTEIGPALKLCRAQLWWGCVASGTGET